MDFRKFLGRGQQQEPKHIAPDSGDDIGLPLPPPPKSSPKSPAIVPDSEWRKSSTGVSGLSAYDSSNQETREIGGVVQNEVDDSVYRLRAEQVQRIEAMFGEFGPAVCSFLLTQSLMPGGVKRVTQKLEIASRGRDGADLAQIESWISAHGAELFCEKVRIRMRPRSEGTPTPNPDAKPGDSPSASVMESRSFKARGQLSNSDSQSRPADFSKQVDIRPVTVNGVAQDPEEPPVAPPPPPPAPPPQRPVPTPPSEPKGFMFAPKKKEEE